MAVLMFLAACGGGPARIPEPRPLVNFGGARIRVERDRMQEVHDWVTRADLNITEDPTFWVISNVVADETYPWENVEFGTDTVRISYDPRANDSSLIHRLYGHLHLMVRMGRQAEWLPEAPTATGYELERAILSRVADAWLLGRTVFDTAPYDPLDELMYAKEAGYLDAFVFTARPNEFVEARAAWARAKPDEAERYRAWFSETFNREPPGLRQP
jgi:hypothetical protein